MVFTPSLLRTLPSDPRDVIQGLPCSGAVTEISGSGISVIFDGFIKDIGDGNLTGFISWDDLASDPGTAQVSSFWIGRPLLVKVVDVEESTKAIRLELVSDISVEFLPPLPSALASLRTGEVMRDLLNKTDNGRIAGEYFGISTEISEYDPQDPGSLSEALSAVTGSATEEEIVEAGELVTSALNDVRISPAILRSLRTPHRDIN